MQFTVNRIEGDTWEIVGGFGDRIKGLASVYWLAQFVNERLEINWTKPENIFNFYRLISEDCVQVNSQQGHNFNLIDRGNVINTLETKQLLGGLRDKRICFNQVPLDFFKREDVKPYIPLPNKAFKSPEAFAAATWNRLMRFDTAHKDLNFELNKFRDWAAEQDHVTCVHARIGGRWNDSLITDFDKACQALVTRAKKDSAYFIASDNYEFKIFAQDFLMNAGIPYFLHNGEVVHSDNVAYRSANAGHFWRTVLDFESIKGCDRVYFTGGSFAKLAGYMGNATVLPLIEPPIEPLQ